MLLTRLTENVQLLAGSTPAPRARVSITPLFQPPGADNPGMSTNSIKLATGKDL